MNSIVEDMLREAVNDHKNNKLKEAKLKYLKIISINSNNPLVFNNLGSIFFKEGDLLEAKKLYKIAINLKPNYLEALNSLGNTLYKMENLKEAETYFKKIIKLKPNFEPALLSLGQIEFNNRNYKKAIYYFDLCNTKETRSRALIALYKINEIDEIFERIKKFSIQDEKNLTISAFSSFIENITKKETANNFCKKPLDFLCYSNISSHLKNSSIFVEELITEIKKHETIWEPFRKSTKNGYQSKYDLFTNTSNEIKNLKKIILKEIDNYFIKFRNNDNSFINNWPLKKNLEAWHVVYKKKGYQNPHNHSTAWLSGVIYLKVVPSLEKNEGSIEFSLNSTVYYDENSPKITYNPKVGDIILFPSSLYHRTIPFSSNQERIIVSFNLLPEGFLPNYS